jgi:TonB family protein
MAGGEGKSLSGAVRQFAALPLCLVGIGGCGVAAADDVGNNPPDAIGRTRPTIDKAHPIIIYAYEYPLRSIHDGEQGGCAVRMEVDSDGAIRVRQLVISTGYERLDAACVAAFADTRMMPATLGGKPVASWIVLPLNWALPNRDPPHKIGKTTDEQLEVPIVRQDYDLKVGPDYYPAESRAMHQQGDCTVRAVVRETGPPSDVGLAKSTGFAALDEACVAAIRQAPFLPGKSKQGPVVNVVDITISWRLPAH